MANEVQPFGDAKLLGQAAQLAREAVAVAADEDADARPASNRTNVSPPFHRTRRPGSTSNRLPTNAGNALRQPASHSADGSNSGK